MLPERFAEVLSEIKNRIKTRSVDHPISLGLYGKLHGIEPEQVNTIMQFIVQEGGDLLFASLIRGSLKKITLYGCTHSSVADYFYLPDKCAEFSLKNSLLEEFRLIDFDLLGRAFAPTCRILLSAPMLRILDFSSSWLDAVLADVLTDLVSYSETLESLVLENMRSSHEAEKNLDWLARFSNALADNTVLAILHVSFAYVSLNHRFSKLLKFLQLKNFSLQDLQLQNLDCSSLNQRNRAHARVSMLCFFNKHSHGLFDRHIAHDIFAKAGHQYEGEGLAPRGCRLM